MKTRKLEKRFIGVGEVKGFYFKQIKTSPHGYIYEVRSTAKPHYEVLLRRSNPICIDFTNRVYSTTDFKENYPKKTGFGRYAWTAMTLENAEEILKKINRDARAKARRKKIEKN